MSIKTKFGSASKDYKGYYRISSSKEGNRHKLLHRLIFEDFYQIKLPSNIIIHHDDGNKTNNEIWNLIPMTNAEHISLHNKGHKYAVGRILSKETRKKISEAHKGKTHSIDSCEKISAKKTRTGYFRVGTEKSKTSKHEFTYRYRYYENGKRKGIWASTIEDLKEKVLAEGLPWKKVEVSSLES